MPKDAPSNKIKKTKSNGAEVILYTRHIESREKIAEKISEERGYPLVKPFDNENIIAGQGTFGSADGLETRGDEIWVFAADG